MDFKPGATIGLLGGGQLARMTILAGRPLGYQFAVFTGSDLSGDAIENPLLPLLCGPIASVCDRIVAKKFSDLEALEAFAASVNVLTLEFENIPVSSLQRIEKLVPLRPYWRVLEVCQNREREKEFLEEHGYPCAAFRVVSSLEELAKAVSELGAPCVLKTSELGYDGKGQVKIADSSEAEIERAWNLWATSSEGKTGNHRGVVEEWIEFAAELSVICTRSVQGQISTFPLIENIHTNHILDLSIAPGRFPHAVSQTAMQLAESIAEELKIVGTLAVEMFLLPHGELLVNELAPRTHNSGHFSIDACTNSQFEQHVRAVCGLPLGEGRQLCPAVMVNLLGDLWFPRDLGACQIVGEKLSPVEPDWALILQDPGAKLHLYGKTDPRIGRKMGHFTVLAPTVDEALERARAIQQQMG